MQSWILFVKHSAILPLAVAILLPRLKKQKKNNWAHLCELGSFVMEISVELPERCYLVNLDTTCRFVLTTNEL